MPRLLPPRSGWCDSCGKNSAVVEFGGPDEPGNSCAVVCVWCLRKAVAMVEAAEYACFCTVKHHGVCR